MMWLINTENYSLHEVQGPGEDHPYAILSHTWEESIDNPLQREVTFQDMANLPEAKKKTGWAKIAQTCALAKNYSPSLKWAWIDTCCIDKSSSAELTEAINSMFSWYRQAKVCFVYLSDLPPSPTANLHTKSSRDHMSDFLPGCRWFKRGWTLQELIAPNKIIFYDQVWRDRGTKTELGRLISRRTGIDQFVLNDCENLSLVPVGRRMSWISDRSTKRVEDIAYCLFGIFDVNMPLIYGEGNKAFIRLQTVIAQQNNDLSLFAWSVDNSNDEHGVQVQKYHGMFAKSHHYFKGCKDLVAFQDPLIFERTYFTVTNRGLEFQAPLAPDPKDDDYMMNLFCQNNELELTSGRPALLVIRLVKTQNGFVRHRADKVPIGSDVNPTHIWPGKLEIVLVPTFISSSESRRLERNLHNAFRFRIQSPGNISVELQCSVVPLPRGISFRRIPISKPPHAWHSATKTFLTGGYPLFTGVVCLQVSSNDEKVGSWPHNLRVLFGLTPSLPARRNLHTQDSMDPQPWVAFFAKNDDYVEICGDYGEHLFEKIKKGLYGDYGPATSALGYILRELGNELFGLPKGAILTPSKYISGSTEKQEKARVNLSIVLKDVEEGGMKINEVIIRLEPVEPGNILLPIKELRRSQSIPRFAY